jgi:hypothetical protein
MPGGLNAEAGVPVFSFMGRADMHPAQMPCWITHTNERTHDIIRSGFDRSPMFMGKIEGVGPRYCPSVEDKINRFADKDNHQIFLEPEGLTTHEFYPNGISTSLPFDIQYALVRSMKGLENAHILRPGYAIEYDYFDPRSLKSSFETRQIGGLFFAGQINGTTGYEEAASQGLFAGINAALQCRSLSGVGNDMGGAKLLAPRQPHPGRTPALDRRCGEFAKGPRAPAAAGRCAQVKPIFLPLGTTLAVQVLASGASLTAAVLAPLISADLGVPRRAHQILAASHGAGEKEMEARIRGFRARELFQDLRCFGVAPGSEMDARRFERDRGLDTAATELFREERRRFFRAVGETQDARELNTRADQRWPFRNRAAVAMLCALQIAAREQAARDFEM